MLQQRDGRRHRDHRAALVGSRRGACSSTRAAAACRMLARHRARRRRGGGGADQPGSKPDELPLVRLPGGTELRNPRNGELSRALGIGLELEPREEVDLVVIGGGPAGLGAAVYGASEGLETLVVESTVLGGQAGASRRIENYLGFPAGISGMRADQPRGRTGAQVRRPDGDAVPRARARAGQRTGTCVELEDEHEVVGARRRARHRRRVPAPARRRPRGLRGHQRLLRRRPARGPALRRHAGRASSAAATRPARPRSGWPAAARS